MPQFTYRAKDRKGAVISGQLEADNRLGVNTRLQAMGYFPVDIQATGEGQGALAALQKGRKRRVATDDLTAFYRQMSDLIGAGVPLVKALNIVKNQTPNVALQAILAQVMNDVQEGDTFAGSLEKHAHVFNKLNVALVRAGEAGGLLDQTLARIADYSETQDELRAKVRGALAYPLVMMLVGAAAVTVLLVFVMPKVLTVFQELGQALPLPTLILIGLVHVLTEYKLFIVAGLVVAVVGVNRWLKTERGADQYHRILLKVPKLGTLLLKRQIAAFARTLGSLLRNGVPILNSLSIAAEVMTMRPVRAEIEKIPESITQGSGIAPSLRTSPLFPPVVVNMVAVGEETGQLPEVLLRVAGSYEMQVERDIKTLTSFIEPVIILVMGVVVGFIVFAMLLPIFSIDPTQGL